MKPEDITALGRELKMALGDVFVSPNVLDSNFEHANVVDSLDKIGKGLHKIAAAITHYTDVNMPDEGDSL